MINDTVWLVLLQMTFSIDLYNLNFFINLFFIVCLLSILSASSIRCLSFTTWSWSSIIVLMIFCYSGALQIYMVLILLSIFFLLFVYHLFFIHTLQNVFYLYRCFHYAESFISVLYLVWHSNLGLEIYSCPCVVSLFCFVVENHSLRSLHHV